MSTNRIRQALQLGLALSLLVMSTSLSAQETPERPALGERIGAQLDRGIDRLSDELREGWASLRQTVDRMGVQGRVYSRLRWDKHLAEAELDIDSEEGGIVVLRGNVPSPEARQKAIQLAEDTVGVERVVDKLTVVSPEPETDL